MAYWYYRILWLAELNLRLIDERKCLEHFPSDTDSVQSRGISQADRVVKALSYSLVMGSSL